MSARTQIAAIDQQIDAVHAELRRLEKIRPMSAASWQRAYDKHPKLHERERALYLQRGQLQQARDAEEWKAAKKAAQAERRRQRRSITTTAKTCPVCGHALAA
jgi:hypothetical protein